jgi:cysteine desulfurase
VLRLDLDGIRISTGSACASGMDEPSATLAAIGTSRALARSSVRFSMGRDTSREDIEYVLSRLPAALERLGRK